jgi:hypothetical protein
MEYITIDGKRCINTAHIVEFTYLHPEELVKRGTFGVVEGSPSSIRVTLTTGEKIEIVEREADEIFQKLTGKPPRKSGPATNIRVLSEGKIPPKADSAG